MSDTRSRTRAGPRRFIGGAEISTNRTAPSWRTFSVSKNNGPFPLTSGVVIVISSFQRSDLNSLPAITYLFESTAPLLVRSRHVCFQSIGNHHRATDEMSVLEIVVRLFHSAERIAVHEGLDPTQSGHVEDLLQRNAAAVQARRQLGARRYLEEVEGNGAAPSTDHSQAALPREGGDACGEGLVHSHAIQDKCRPNPAGELANLVCSVRTTRDDVGGAV